MSAKGGSPNGKGLGVRRGLVMKQPFHVTGRFSMMIFPAGVRGFRRMIIT
jgi:hypothetical protein